MKLIKPNVEIIEQQPGLEGMYKQIELAGRTCYKSEDKFVSNTSSGMLKTLVSNNHESVLEHEKLTMLFIIDLILQHWQLQSEII